MHERARGHEVERSHSHFLCLKTKKKQNKGERRAGKSHARTCKRTRSRVQSLSFFMSKSENNWKQDSFYVLIHNIMGRYGYISSFFVQKILGKWGDVHLLSRKTEILCLSFRFSGKFDWKIKDIFLKTKNLNGLSTYIYGRQDCLTW